MGYNVMDTIDKMIPSSSSFRSLISNIATFMLVITVFVLFWKLGSLSSNIEQIKGQNDKYEKRFEVMIRVLNQNKLKGSINFEEFTFDD
jgi:hypothetical protein